MEILIAVAFLAICASAIVEGVWTSNLQATYALRRAKIMSALQDQLEGVRALASAGSLSNYSGTTTPTIASAGTVTITTTVTLESGSLTLWDVTASATWTESTASGTRTDSASLSTVVID